MHLKPKGKTVFINGTVAGYSLLPSRCGLYMACFDKYLKKYMVFLQ